MVGAYSVAMLVTMIGASAPKMDDSVATLRGK